MDLFDYLKILPKMRQRQLRQAVFVDLVSNSGEVTTFSKADRAAMEDRFDLIPFSVEKESVSKDGSIKFLLKTRDGQYIETVLLFFKDGRNTVCVSSQIGCPLGCAFCATGKLGLKRNLTAWEIISQVLIASRRLRVEGRKLTNVVFMGMGEPLLNLDNVLLAIRELTSPEGLGLGARHITISTAGPLSQLREFIGQKTRTTLAISLHASNQKLREKLMPVARGNGLDDLMVVLDDYVAETNKRVSYEYIMLDGINDNESNAEELAGLLKGRLSHVNLIAYNNIDGSSFKPSTKETIAKFDGILKQSGINVTLRVSLGDKIAGACGQLAGGKQN